MAMTAEIKSIKREDGQLIAYCSTEHGQAFSVVLPKACGEFYPLPGDVVTAVESGQEFHVVSVFCNSKGEPDLLSGDHFVFARDENGNVVSWVHAKSDGIVSTGPKHDVGEARDYVAMAQKVNDSFSAVLNSISGAAVGSADGGAAFKANIISALQTALNTVGTVASKNLRAE